MKKNISVLVLLSIFFFYTSCGPTTILTRTWTDPSIKGSTFTPFKKVLMIARLKDETGNRIAEDKMVKSIKQGLGVQSYSYLSSSDTLQSKVDARLKKDGFDGLILMRLVNVEENVNVQNTGYGGYYGSRYGHTTVYVDKNYLVETTIYTLDTGKLLWSGTTSSLNPSSIEQTIDEIITAVRAQMIKQGLIKE